MIAQTALGILTLFALVVSAYLAMLGNKETRLLTKNETTKFARKAIHFAEFNSTALRLKDVYNHPWKKEEMLGTHLLDPR